ncbi:MAG: LamG-like jellyroll fold domain-containing protein [Candidatus Fimimorpha sp.]
MKKRKIYAMMLASSLVLGLIPGSAFAESSTESSEIPNSIVNGNFETGDLTGWEVLEGDAFAEGRVSDETLFWKNEGAASLVTNRKFHNEGKYFLRGFEALEGESGIEQKTGSMRSTTFILEGSGYISFLMGGGRQSDMYVALCDANTNEELSKISNSTYFMDPALSENLHRVFWDVSAYKGKEVYIKIVDNWADGGFGAINVDDFITYLPEEDLENLYHSYKEGIESIDDISEVKAAMKIALSKQVVNIPGDAPEIISIPENLVIRPEKEVNINDFLDAVLAKDDYTPEASLERKIVSIALEGEPEQSNIDFSKYDLSVLGAYLIKFEISDACGQSTSGTLKLHVSEGTMPEDFVNTKQDTYEDSAIVSLKFDEGAGTTVSDSKNQISATIKNDPDISAYRPKMLDPFWTQRSAVSGSALSFDGLNNSIEYSSNVTNNITNKMTLEVFVAPRNYVWSDTNAPIENWLTHIICGQYNNDSGFKVGMTKYGYWTFQVYVDGKGWQKVYCNSSYKLETYEWNHLTCVFDGENGKLQIYKDGNLAGETSFDAGNMKKADVPFIVGRGNQKVDNGVVEYDMSHFDGLMDELKIYNIAKTQSDITSYHSNFTEAAFMKAVVYDDCRVQESYTEEDYYRPQLHAEPPMHWMNEPHALFQYNGRWHLFYQSNSYAPFWQGGITWGHWVSDDMIDWTHVKDAVIPMENSVAHDGVWTGNMAFNSDGVPVLFITAGNDKRIDVDGTSLLSNQNIAIATPKDPSDPNLTEWILADGLSVEQGDLSQDVRGVASEFRDPQIFEEDGVYYMVICGRSQDSKPIMHLYTTENGNFYTQEGDQKNYKVWTYRGNVMPQTFYDNYDKKFGMSAELPNIAPLYSPDGKTKKYILCFAPSPNAEGIDIGSYYWIGTFDKETYTFIPDKEGAPTVVDTCYKAFSGGTIYFDPSTHKTYIVGVIQDDRYTMERKNSGWAHAASMVREIYLKEDGTLGIKSAADFSQYVDKNAAGIQLSNVSVEEVNNAIASIDHDMLKISFKIKANEAAKFGLKLKKESDTDFIKLEYNNGKIGIVKSTYTPNVGVGKENTMDTFSDLALTDGCLSGEIYIDHAMIEAFFNNSAVISSMVYNRSNQIEVYGDGVEYEYFNVDYLVSDKDSSEIEKPASIEYTTHVQNIGWQDYVADGAMSGTSGKGLRLEGIRMQLNHVADGGISYRAYVQNIGWQDYVTDGAMAGTKGKGLRLEAIQAQLTGAIAERYDLYYRTHVQNLGWLGWAKNGGKSGSAGLSKRLEAVQVVLVEKGNGNDIPGSLENAYITNKKTSNPSVIYTTHVQNIGWQKEVTNGTFAGTKGKGLRLEGIKIRVNGDGLNGGVEYSTHVQNLGWQSYVSNGMLSGTKGKSLRLEAIKIRLTGELAQKYSVEYRVHVQNLGWQTWVKDNAMAGTKGKSLRLEGIQIRLIKK